MLTSLEVPVLSALQPPFVTLFPAYDEGDSLRATGLVGRLVDLGCVEFCCVGPDAEKLHDAIDWIVEEREAFDVVTTGVEDELEACEYFVFAAAGKPQVLLALVSSHPRLVAILEGMMP